VHDGVTPRLEERTPEGALVRTISFATNVVPELFHGFYGLKVDSGGRIYTMPGRLVERSDPDGAGVVSFARPYGVDASEVEGLVALAGGPDGVWAITQYGTRVVHFDSVGRPLARWDDYWTLGRPFRAIGADAAGGVWVTAQNELRVARLDPGGVVTPLFELTPPPEWNLRPYDEIDTLVPDGSGGFFITLTGFLGTRWAHLDAGGQILGTRNLSSPDSYGTYLLGPVLTGDRELRGIERSRYDIRRFQFDFTELAPVVLSPAPPQVEFGTSVLAMVVDPAGELTVSAATPEPALLRFDPSGRRQATWLPVGVDGETLMPALLAYDRRGHLYVGDQHRDTITIFAPALNYGPGAGVRP
jgi:streptogramin lyase